MNDSDNKAIRNIFEINLGIKGTEKALIFTDDHDKDLEKLTELISEAGKDFTKDITYLKYSSTECHGVEPPEEIWEIAFGKRAVVRLKEEGLLKPLLSKKADDEQMGRVEEIIKDCKDDAVDAVIALSYYSTSHTRFRDLLNRVCGARYASMPLFDREMLYGPMNVNWDEMLERTKRIADKVNDNEQIEIKSSNGTALLFSKKGRTALSDTGIVTKPGSFSNLPAGEVYLAPLEGTANGKLVLEWAPTRKLESAITLHVKDGIVQRVEGDERYVEVLVEKLNEKKENRNIAELGIGTNDKASRPDNILESEKIFGTVHVALGDNSSFGGRVRTSFHQDFIFFNPTVTLIHKDGSREELCRDGAYYRC